MVLIMGFEVKATCVAALSLCLTTTTISNAFIKKKQFYPSVVYLSKSNLSLAILYFQAFVVLYYIGRLLKKLFFGELRSNEIEHLFESLWYSLTDTALAFTAFREDFSPVFFAIFCFLLCVKSFHTLVGDRINYMERTPRIPRIYHIRMISMLSILTLIDVFSIGYAYNSIVTRGVSYQLVFGFEYTILFIVTNFAICKYLLNCVDMYVTDDQPWDGKAFILMHGELLVNTIKVAVYAIFVVTMVRYYHFPLFVIRPLYMSMRQFKKSVTDIVLSRRALNLLATFPDAGTEEINAGDTTCIICRDEMTTGCKKLPCNHIFHVACLRSWFQRQQNCPLCRDNIFINRDNAANVGQAMPGGFMFPNQQANANGAPNLLANAMPQFQHPFGFPGAVPPMFPPIQPNAFMQAPAPMGNQAQQNNAQPPASTAFPNLPQNSPFFFNSTVFNQQEYISNLIRSMPSPPVDTSSMSIEQLENMENDHRKLLETRVEHLRQAQICLDSAVALIDSYFSAYPTPVQSSSTQGVSNANASQSSDQPATETNVAANETQATNSARRRPVQFAIKTVKKTASSIPSTSGSSLLKRSSLAAPATKNTLPSNSATSAINEPSSSKAALSGNLMPATVSDVNENEENENLFSDSAEEMRRARLRKLQQGD